MIRGIHHIAIITAEYAKSKHFYEKILGLQVIAENYRAARDSWKCDLRAPDGIYIELFSFPDPPSRPSRPEACGLRHLSFAVDDLDAAIAELKKHGVICEPVREDVYTGKKFTFCSDPDGLPIELYSL